MPRLTQKFQVTLPKNVRDVLKVHSGDQVDFIVGKDGRIEVITPDPHSPFDQYIGYLKPSKGRDSDKIVAQMRGRTR